MVTKTSTLELPKDVREVLHRFFTAEFTTVGKDATPVTWPITVRFLEDEGRFLLTTSIGMPGKAHNLRRDNRVSLSYSDPTGSGLFNAPRVVVQGTATLDEEIRTSVEGLEDYWRETIFYRQPQSKAFSDNAIMRWLMDWYYMRHVIIVDPIRVVWWPDGDYSREPLALEVMSNVE